MEVPQKKKGIKLELQCDLAVTCLLYIQSE